MSRYLVMNETFTYGRVIEADSSFDARRTVAHANNVDITTIIAIREDLMGANDWNIWHRIKNK